MSLVHVNFPNVYLHVSSQFQCLIKKKLEIKFSCHLCLKQLPINCLGSVPFGGMSAVENVSVVVRGGQL